MKKLGLLGFGIYAISILASMALLVLHCHPLGEYCLLLSAIGAIIWTACIIWEILSMLGPK